MVPMAPMAGRIFGVFGQFGHLNLPISRYEHVLSVSPSDPISVMQCSRHDRPRGSVLVARLVLAVACHVLGDPASSGCLANHVRYNYGNNSQTLFGAS